jgi:anti-sigma factor RsiW
MKTGVLELKTQCKNGLRISAFADAELPDYQMEEIHSHLEECEACRKQLAMLQQTDQLIRNIPEIEPSRNFEKNFWKKIADMEEKKNRRSIFDLFQFRYKPFAMASLTAMIIAGFVLWSKAPRSPELNEVVIAENLELLQNFQEIRHLELLENWENIMKSDEKS